MQVWSRSEAGSDLHVCTDLAVLTTAFNRSKHYDEEILTALNVLNIKFLKALNF